MEAQDQVLTWCRLVLTGLPQGVESQDSEQFFRKVLGVSDGSTLGGMKPIMEGSKGELNRSALPQRALLSGEYSRAPAAGLPAESLRLFCTNEENADACQTQTEGEMCFSGSLPSAGMMDAFPGLSQSPFFDMR